MQRRITGYSKGDAVETTVEGSYIIGLHMTTIGALLLLHLTGKPNSARLRVCALIILVFGEALLFPWDAPIHALTIALVVFVNSIITLHSQSAKNGKTSRKSGNKPGVSVSKRRLSPLEIIAETIWHGLFKQDHR
jgi:hypothetical protein